MTTAALERSMLKRLKNNQTIDPRILAKLSDDGPVGAGSENVSATDAPRNRRIPAVR